MTPDEIKTLICELFLKGDTAFPLAPDTDLLQEGICDSLGLVQIATALEARHPSLRIHDPEITAEHFGSISRIQAFLASKLGA